MEGDSRDLLSAATGRTDKVDCSDGLHARQFHRLPLRLQYGSVRINHVQVAYSAILNIACGPTALLHWKQKPRLPECGSGRQGCADLKVVLDLSKGDENQLAIICDVFVECRQRVGQIAFPASLVAEECECPPGKRTKQKHATQPVK